MSKQQWFRAKRYGWGWTPNSWQGWLAIGVFVTLIVGGSMFLFGDEPETTGQIVLFVAWFVSCLMCLLVVSYRKGEKPGWHWGSKSHPKDKNE